MTWFFSSFTRSLHFCSMFMFTQWFQKLGLWHFHKLQSSCLNSCCRATNKSMLWVIRAIRKPLLMVFRVTRKLMLWYLEQQVNSCYGIKSNKKSMLRVIWAIRKSMPPLQGHILEILDLSKTSWPNLTKNRDATLRNTLIGSILWNKKCHVMVTLRKSLRLPKYIGNYWNFYKQPYGNLDIV